MTHETEILKNALTALTDAYISAGNPTETIRTCAAAVGFDATAAVIASLVNRISDYDGRISPRNAAWAKDVPGALPDHDTCIGAGIYTDVIHPAHIDNLAQTVRKLIESGDPVTSTPAPAADQAPATETHANTPTPVINEETARRAHEMRSFSDYKPGSATAEYEVYCAEADEVAERQKKRVDPMYHDKIDGLLAAYKRRMAEYINRENEIGTRCPSVMIAGPSNFPTRKKEKQVAAWDANHRFYEDTQALLNKIRGVGTGGISADDPRAVEKLEAKLEKLKAAQERMKAANAAIRKKDTAAGNAKLAELGFTPEQIVKLREPDFCGRIGFPSFELTNNGAEIRRVEARIKELRNRAENPLSGFSFDGGEVVADTADNRLRIVFDGKPDDNTREALKGNGFRWSPKASAWQRQLTPAAIRAARYALKQAGVEIAPVEAEVPYPAIEAEETTPEATVQATEPEATAQAEPSPAEEPAEETTPEATVPAVDSAVSAGAELIRREMADHPLLDGEPVVTVLWSESAAFVDFNDASGHCNLQMSVAAADAILRKLDEEFIAANEGGYDKTKFTITGGELDGQPCDYTGRYDIGDGDGGLIEHIRQLGEWDRTHEIHGKLKETPDETNDALRFADYLAGFLPAGGVAQTEEPAAQEPAAIVPAEESAAEPETVEPQEEQEPEGDVIDAILTAAAEIPGCTATVRGRKTARSIVWMEGVTKEHKDEAKALGGLWAPKKKAWYVTADRYERAVASK